MSSFLSYPEFMYRRASLSRRSILVQGLILLSILLSNLTLAAPPHVNILDGLASPLPPPPPDTFSPPVDLECRTRIPRVPLEADKETSSAPHENLATLNSQYWKGDKKNKEALEELQTLWQSKVEGTKVHADFQSLENSFREARIRGSSGEKADQWLHSMEDQLPKIQSLLLHINYRARGEPFPAELVARLFGETTHDEEARVRDILLVIRNVLQGTARYDQHEVNLIHKPAFSALQLLLEYSLVNHQYLGNIVGKELYTQMAARLHSFEQSPFSAHIMRGADLVGGLYQEKVAQEISDMKKLAADELLKQDSWERKFAREISRILAREPRQDSLEEELVAQDISTLERAHDEPQQEDSFLNQLFHLISLDHDSRIGGVLAFLGKFL